MYMGACYMVRVCTGRVTYARVTYTRVTYTHETGRAPRQEEAEDDGVEPAEARVRQRS